ncbi:MAG: apolipoprotein N-acyltransferase [Nocardioides sp.]
MVRRLLLASLAGVLTAAAFEPVAAAWLVPVGVAGFVLATRGLRARRAWLPGLVFGVAFYFPLIWWMRAVGTDAWLALAGIESLFYGVLGSAVAVLGRQRWWPLGVAAAWTTMESVRSTWPFSGMPWGRLAFAAVDTPVQDTVAYAGSTGLGFLLALTGCLLAALVVTRGRGRLVPVVALGVVLAALLLPALVPWRAQPEREVTVAAVQGNVPGAGDSILLDYRQVTRNHVDATVGLARAVAEGDRPRPDFVIWPENSTAVDPFLDTGTNTDIWTASRAIDVPILVGAVVDAGPQHVLNQGIVWEPGVGAGDRYTKWHPVPYGEYIPFRGLFSGNFGRLAIVSRDMLAGTRTEPLSIAGVRVADAICFDVAYDDGLYAQVRRGAEMVAVQTSNATFIHTDQIDQQFAISRLRAIETGRYLVVAATNGVSGIIAPDGRVLDRAEVRTQDVLDARVGLTTALTPAVRLGAWPSRVFTLGSSISLLAGLLAYRRRRASTPPAPTDE